MLNADAVLLRRALDNLLENADKYSRDPGAPIKLSLSQRAQRVWFEVQDQGIGIASTDLQRVFSPIFSSRTQPRAKRRWRGASGSRWPSKSWKPTAEAFGC